MTVSIDPPTARAGETVSCAWTFEDADGDPDASTLEWKVDGAVVGTSPTLGGTFVGQQLVECVVIPFDGRDEGEPVAASFTVGNTPPVVSDVLLSPDNPAEASMVSVTFAVTDVDGDTPIAAIAWRVNGVVLEGQTGPTLDGSSFSRDDEVDALVTPDDGMDEGLPVSSDLVVIANTPPAVGAVAIVPVSATDWSSVTADAELFDIDGDPVSSTHVWRVNGVIVAGETGETLSAGHFDRGDDLDVEVTPDDGTVGGSPLDASTVSVLNSAPHLSDVALSPTPAFKTDALTLSYGVSDLDLDPVSTSFEWRVNGSLVTGQTGATLQNDFFSKGQTVQATVVAADGDDTSMAAANLTIQNSPPVMDAVSIVPSTPYENQTLTLSVFAHDVDNEPMTPTYEWFVNGDAIPGSNVEMLTNASFDAGDAVACKVFFSDGMAAGNPITSAPVVIQALTVPGPPTGLVVGKHPATVRWTAPVDNGGTPITGYSVTSFLGGTTAGTPVLVGAAATSAVVPDIQGYTSYRFEVRAQNTVGDSDPASTGLILMPCHPCGFPGPTGVPSVYNSSQRDIAKGDFNGDGILDVATIMGSAFSVRLGLGGGTFSLLPSRSVSFQTRTIGAGDFNEDGFDDVVIAYADSPGRAFLSNGDGSFTNGSTVGIGDSMGLEIADLNGDGHADIAATHWGSHSITFRLGTGTGTFVSGSFSTVLSFPRDVATGDIDQDGFRDAATANDNGYVSALFGDGTGHFQDITNRPVGTKTTGVALADFNGDGILDIASVDGETDEFTVIVVTSSRTLAAGSSFPTLRSPQKIGAGDFDGDGDADVFVVAGPHHATTWRVYLGNGDVTFTPGYQSGANDPTTTLTSDEIDLERGDFDGDGIDDFIVANNGDDHVALFVGTQDSSFPFRGAQSFPTGARTGSIAVADFDKDGIPDILAAGTGPDLTAPGTGQLLFGAGSRSFAPGGTFELPPHPSELAVADFNRDGELDFAVGCLSDEPLAIYLGAGGGAFLPGMAVPDIVDSVGDVVAGDFNGDDEEDLAVVSRQTSTTSTMHILLGSGDGTFVAGQVFPGFSYQLSGPADLNDDGHLDLTTVTDSDESVVMLGYGDGTFNTFGQGSSGWILDVADMNSDGVEDLLVMGLAGDLGVRLGSGTGTFGPASSHTLNLGTLIFQFLEDVDGDLIPDAGFVVINEGTLWIVPGDGDTGFSPAQPFYAGDTGGSDPAIPADLDLDGRQDIAVTEYFSETVRVLFQR